MSKETLDAPAWGRGDFVGPENDKGKFQVLDVIKGGGMSKVYRVMDTRLNKIWCYKEIINNKANIDYQALLSEALIMRKLDNPSLPRVTEIFSTCSPDNLDDYDQRTGVIMDWVNGRCLQDIIKKDGKVPLELALQWGVQMCQIMEYLHSDTSSGYDLGDGNMSTGHRPILYRDLKPLNVMIMDKDNTVTLLDFGISVELVNNSLTNDFPMGTAEYAAPEMFEKYAPFDLRSDIYTIGATMYHMITGIPPKPYKMRGDMKPMKAYTTTVTDELEQIIQKAMAINPNDRYDTVYEMRMDLERTISLTPEKMEEYHRKIVISFSLFGLSIASGILAMIPFTMIQNNKNANYEALISVAKSTKDPEDYKRAIADRPSVVNPYLGLIEAYEQDGIVTEDDVQTLKDYLYPNRDKMVDQENYGKLCYTVGEMLWYYYDTNGTGTRPEVQAITWFEEAKEAGYEEKKSDVYVKIGKYWEMQSKSVQLSGNQMGENLKSYWDNLLLAKSFVEGDEELLQYQAYSSLAECIYNYSYQLLQNGVSEEDMRNEVRELQAFVKQVSGSIQMTNRSKQLYEDLKVKVPELTSKIDIATRGGIA